MTYKEAQWSTAETINRADDEDVIYGSRPGGGYSPIWAI